MVLDLAHAALAARLPHLAPYLRHLLAEAGERALELFSDEVATEHVLVACMRDEDCAAHEVVVHAFADPETIELELTALCPGIMVVGSDAALPFSPRAVAAMERARAGTAGDVDVARVFHACVAELGDGARAALAEAGPAESARAEADPPGDAGIGNRSEPLFRRFEDDAKRALSLASKAAGQARDANLSPGRLALGCLQADPSLGERLGVPLARARSVLRPYLLDASRPDPRRIPPAPELVGLLEGLAEGADSLTLLHAAARAGPDELRALLQRHKISESLLERARDAFRDPRDPPSN